MLTAEEKMRRGFDNIYDRYQPFASIVQSWIVYSRTCDCIVHPISPDEIAQYGHCKSAMPTAATDGPRLWYNTKFVDRLSIADTTALILHEAMHIFCGHHMRFADLKSAREWNVAADLAGNDYIYIHLPQDGKLISMACLPGVGKFAHLPRGKDAEWYLDAVKEMKPKPQPGQGKPQPQEKGDKSDSGNGGGGEGDEGEESESEGGSESSEKPQDGSKGSGSNKSSSKGDKGQDEAQKGSGGAGLPDELPEIEDTRPDLPRSLGEILPHPSSGDPEAMEEAKQEWEQDVARAVRTAKSCGNMPGWLQSLADTLIGNEPDEKINWKAYLKRFCIKNVPVGGQTFQRMNRRFGYRRDIIIPAEQSKQAANGVLLTDVSGSMHTSEMNLGLYELSQIFAAYGKCSITMMQADTRLIADGEKLFTKKDLPLKVPQTWYGRGGTNLVGAIEEIGKMSGARRWKYLIILSDMEWNYTEARNPGIPTMWITTRAITEDVPFGMAIGPITVDEG